MARILMTVGQVMRRLNGKKLKHIADNGELFKGAAIKEILRREKRGLKRKNAQTKT